MNQYEQPADENIGGAEFRIWILSKNFKIELLKIMADD